MSLPCCSQVSLTLAPECPAMLESHPRGHVPFWSCLVHFTHPDCSAHLLAHIQAHLLEGSLGLGSPHASTHPNVVLGEYPGD